MPAPAESHPEIIATRMTPAISDETTAVASGDPTGIGIGIGTGTGFGPPAAGGEVGTLGPYRVVKELGRGGMGAVYAAIDTRLDRQLALKVMLPAFAADASAKERFLREARAAAKINHDNVVTVYEADERQGMPYIAMQFLKGVPLDEYLKKKGLPAIRQVLRIAAETAAGLAAAHKIGLVHRDIKPGNLWLEVPHGRVKVLDFGLAKPVDAEFELTKSGAVVGTPAYMSPEQARSEKVDHRTDLFSLGAVLYRLCTGKLPFNGPTTMAVLMALGTEEPTPVREVNPSVPESLAALIHQLLAKRADARPQSAGEVMKRVRAIAEDLVAPRPQSAELSTSQPQPVQPPVVYAVLSVAAPEADPFADPNASDTDPGTLVENEESTRALKPDGKKAGGRWRWPAVGFAALAALVLGGVIIIIKNKDGTETKIEVPDGAMVTVKDKGGKTLAEVGPGTKNPPAADTSADRKAAEWVIAQGGSVSVSGAAKEVKAAADLPKERFTVGWVQLSNTKATDAGLAHLKELKGLTHINLVETEVTDAGLVHLKELKGLTSLYLGGTKVTGAGLAHLKELKGLTVLYLLGTKVTDAGLAHLKELNSLKELFLSGTEVTDAGLVHLKEHKGLTHLGLVGTKATAKGLAALAAALPACEISHDGGVMVPKK